MKKNTFACLLCILGVLLWLPVQPAIAQDGGRSEDERFEIGVDLGAQFGDVFGRPRGTCVPASNAASALNCDPASNPASLFLGNLSNISGGLLPNLGGEAMGIFRTTPVLHPREHFQWGARAGVDLTPHWQVEFMFLYSYADLSFNQDQLNQAINELRGAFDFINRNIIGIGPPPPVVELVVVDDGQPRGRNEVYQWNLNYHVNTTGHVVGYVGGGLGFIRYRRGPNMTTQTIDVGGFFLSPDEVLFEGSTRTGDDTSFAFNFGGGVKFYATRHLGVRLEVRNLISRFSTTHTFRTLDNNSVMCTFFFEPFCTTQPVIPNTGTFEQRNWFNHLSLTVGVFGRF